jgi:4-alpha-glucanotransferase
MRVLQFGFDGNAANPHLPHNLERNELVYSGTHDNDTSLGWYRGLGAEDEARVNLYLGCTSDEMPMALVRATLASVAQLAILPVQDLLALGSEARFNVPGTAQGNWQWRLAAGALDESLARRYRILNELYGRHSAQGQ